MSTPDKTPAAYPITVEQVKNQHYFSVKDLKKMLENLDDDMVVAIHRVEDHYFKSFGENGWKAIKALWHTFNVSEKKEKQILDWIKSPECCDPSLHEIATDKDGDKVCREYIDVIPAFQAYVAKEKGDDGKKVFVITPHY